MKTELTPEQNRLKQFIQENFPFDDLKQLGFWPKGTKRTDYEAQAARVCHFFGYASVYEYRAPEVTQLTDLNNLTGKVEPINAAIAQMPGSINESGEYVVGDTGLIATSQSHFTCPVCTCEQQVSNRRNMYQKCKGCKRSLGVVVDLVGNIQVWEK